MPPRNRRHDPRTPVTWPVVIETRRQRFPCQVVDISPHGAKVQTSAPLRLGSVVHLQIIPPTGSPLRVGALVWRLDPDGIAFFFAHGISHPVIRVA
jgi:PilZ domain-containing protein